MRVLLHALPLLGVSVEHESQSVVTIHGTGGPYSVENAHLELENAGTAVRPLVALLSAGKGRFVVDGNEQMRRRPIRDLIRGLELLGVKIESADGCPPVTIHAEHLHGGETTLPGTVSSQFISALLLAAPLAREKDIELIVPEEPVSRPYIDLTVRMMEQFGVNVDRDAYRRFQIPHGRVYASPGAYTIEGDATAATYFLALGALPGSGPVRVEGVGAASLQGDVHFIDLLEKMGAQVKRGSDWLETRGPASGKLRALDVDMNDMPDAAMTMAVLALFADGTTNIRNIANLRVKESERIHGLAVELRKLGAAAEESPDSLAITPAANLRPASIGTYKDHRMAMAFSLASWGTELAIEDPACVNKTYPRYFDDFALVRKTD